MGGGELQAWFEKNKIPQVVIDCLLDNGFEFLDIVLDMNESDVKDLGLKVGHEKKLIKCIQESKSTAAPNAEITIARPPSARPKSKEGAKKDAIPDPLDNWSLIMELYDDRVLSSGTSPADSLKFWASLSRLQFENIIDTIKKQASAVETHPKMAASIKSKCLQQVAMVLSDAGSFEDAETFARTALTFEKTPSREYEIKALLVYAWHCKLKKPMWVRDTKDVSPFYKLVELCDDIEKNGSLISREKLCKVLILKGFTCQSLINRDKNSKETHGKAAEQALEEALSISKAIQNKGLEAEATMTKGLYLSAINTRDKNSLALLLASLKLSTDTWGEFSTLNARIYYNIAIDFEVNHKLTEAYECFRRTWLIDRQIYGPHHPATNKSGSVLTDDYRSIAASLKDSLPDDDSGGPNERDRNFQERIKFLYQL
jgi:tetratricopeptide (TPR) repeat protein